METVAPSAYSPLPVPPITVRVYVSGSTATSVMLIVSFVPFMVTVPCSVW